MFKTVLLTLAVSALSFQSRAQGPDIDRDLATLETAAVTKIHDCERKISAVYLKGQVEPATPGEAVGTRAGCAAAAEAALGELVSPLRTALENRPQASDLLDDWLSSWKSVIESLPLTGVQVDESALDEKMRQVVVEMNL